MKTEKFDYVDEKDAIRIIGMRLKKIGRIVSPEFKNELEYELRDFFKSKNNYRGTVELELRSDSDLIVKKYRVDGKNGSHSYSTSEI